MNSSTPAPAPAQPLVIRIRFWAEIARLMVILMELMLVSGWYNSLDAGQNTWAGIALVLGLVVIVSHYLSRLLNVVHISERRRRVIFTLWALLAMFASLKLLIFPRQPISLLELLTFPFHVIGPQQNPSLGGFVHLLLAGFLIWRGVALAASTSTLAQVQRSFQFGIFFLFLYGFSVGRADNTSYVLVFVFLILGVLGIASARMSLVSELRGGRAGGFSRQWVLAIGLSTLALVGFALLAGLLLDAPAAWLVKLLSGLIMGLLAILLVVVAYPMLWLVTLIGPVISDLFANMPQLELFNMVDEWMENLDQFQLGVSEEVTQVLTASRVGLRLLAVAGIILLALLVLRYRPLRHRAEPDEVTSSVDASFQWPWKARDPRRILAAFPGARRWLAAAHVRRIYADLMALFRKLEHPRPDSLTPLEFLPQMQTELPEESAELDQITAAYLSVRYGQYPETQEEIQAIQQAWSRVRSAGGNKLAKMRSNKKKSRPDHPASSGSL